MQLRIQSKNINEALARSAVAAFCVELDPSIEQINDIKTAVSEAVTNAIIHGYDGREDGIVTIDVQLDGTTVHITVSDRGAGIGDIEQARRPFFTTKPTLERSGMGFTVMESFMDTLEITSGEDGTIVTMTKDLSVAADW